MASERVLVLFGRTHESVWHLVDICHSNGCCDAACGTHFDADYVTCDREEPFDTVLHPGDERCGECFAGIRPLRDAEQGPFAQILDAFSDRSEETDMTHDRTKDPRITSTGGVTPGYETEPAAGPVGPDGQHSSYWVLTPEERAKGFVRPVRNKYIHEGNGGPQHPTRELTAEEIERHDGLAYVLFEPYGEGEAVTGRYWTQEKLDAAKACGTVTKMGNALAETYAVDPTSYGATFCVACKDHYPVEEFVWDDGSGERVGS